MTRRSHLGVGAGTKAAASAVVIGLLSLGSTACNDPTAAAPVDAALLSDAGVDSGLGKGDVSDSDAAACGPGVYPCGPYGTTEGDVVADLRLSGFMDPDNHCKGHTSKVMDLSKPRTIAFKDWYLGDPKTTCLQYKKRLLWVLVTAGTGMGGMLANAVQKAYTASQLDARVGVLALVIRDYDRPITEATTKKWITDLSLTFPVAMDPSEIAGAYMVTPGTFPFNMLVDLETMQIVYRLHGNDVISVGEKIKGLLIGTP